MHYLYPAVLFLLAVGSFVGSYFALRQDIYPHIKNRADCENKAKFPADCQNDPSCCAVWKADMCYKGKVEDGKCKAKSNMLALALMALGVVLFVLSIVCLFLCKGKSKMQFRFW